MPSDAAPKPGHARVGQTLAGKYVIESFLGEGGMASVFRASVAGGGEPRHVAVKIMNRELAADPTFAKRFRREATAAARLQNPHSVQILEYGAEGADVYMVMELLTGSDLGAVLTRERRLSEARAARIIMQVCDALSAAHQHGIVHRDLKPENVMLVGDPREDRVKVLDFGIAKLLDGAPQQGESDGPPSSTRSVLTRAGTLIGTPEYMSPEQCRAEPIDPRSDIYSCGVLLYQLVTGLVPFVGEVPFEVVRRHIMDVPRRPSSLVASIHPRLEATILRALSKQAADRQQSARELRAELAALAPELSGARPLSMPGGAPDSGDAHTAIRTPDSDDARTRVRSEADSDRSRTLVKAEAGLSWNRAPMISSHDDEGPDSLPVDSTRTLIAQAPSETAPRPLFVSSQPPDPPPAGPPAPPGMGLAPEALRETPAARPDPAPAGLHAPVAAPLAVAPPGAPPAKATLVFRRPGEAAAPDESKGIRPAVAIAVGIGVGVLAFVLLTIAAIVLNR